MPWDTGSYLRPLVCPVYPSSGTAGSAALVQWWLTAEIEVLAEEPDLCSLSDRESHIICPGMESGPTRWETVSWSPEPGQGISSNRSACTEPALVQRRQCHIRPDDRIGRRNYVCPFYRVPQRSSCYGVFRGMQVFFMVLMIMILLLKDMAKERRLPEMKNST